MPPPTLSRRELGVVAAAALLSACGVAGPRLPGAIPPAASARKRVAVRHRGRVVDVDVEEYVLASALAEVAPVDDSPKTVARIFETQAVLARSFAASHLGRHRAEGFDLCDTTHCQLYDPARIRTSRFAAAARGAAHRTAGQVLVYNGRPAEALFHADCGGHTAAAERVWGGPPVPYLRSAPDAVRPAAHRAWAQAIPREELRAALNGDTRSRVGRVLEAIEIRKRDGSGRVVEVALAGEQRHLLRGEDLRAIVNRRFGVRALQSTRFSVRQDAGAWVFEGTGFGHGVGLCQLGAAARARRGDSLEQILTAYFPGTRLRSW
jgi:stage II sporulation protein D